MTLNGIDIAFKGTSICMLSGLGTARTRVTLKLPSSICFPPLL